MTTGPGVNAKVRFYQGAEGRFLMFGIGAASNRVGKIFCPCFVIFIFLEVCFIGGRKVLDLRYSLNPCVRKGHVKHLSHR